MKFAQRKDRLWILVAPPLLSLALISSIKPSGPFTFCVEISVCCLCSLFCGLALAMKQFDTVIRRLWGTMAYSAAGMSLICCMSFLGCFWLGERERSPTQLRQNLHQQEVQRRAWTARNVVARDALTDPSMLDLTPYYDGIIPGPAPKDPFMRIQQPGTHVWDGIKFDVRGTIGTDWFQETNTIAVDKKCSDVYFLHGSQWGSPPSLVNQFFIHFQNGETETIPILYGTDVSSKIFEHGAVPANAVVWKQIISTNGTPRPFSGFFIKKWKNPSPDEIITSIGFAPQNGGYLVAITIKQATNSIP